MLFLWIVFCLILALASSENIEISCHITDDSNHTHPELGVSHGMKGWLKNCEKYLEFCKVDDDNLIKYKSQFECVTNLGKTVTCAFLEFWWQIKGDSHCPSSLNRKTCEMFKLSCTVEELLMTTETPPSKHDPKQQVLVHESTSRHPEIKTTSSTTTRPVASIITSTAPEKIITDHPDTSTMIPRIETTSTRTSSTTTTKYSTTVPTTTPTKTTLSSALPSTSTSTAKTTSTAALLTKPTETTFASARPSTSASSLGTSDISTTHEAEKSNSLIEETKKERLDKKANPSPSIPLIYLMNLGVDFAKTSMRSEKTIQPSEHPSSRNHTDVFNYSLPIVAREAEQVDYTTLVYLCAGFLALVFLLLVVVGLFIMVERRRHHGSVNLRKQEQRFFTTQEPLWNQSQTTLSSRMTQNTMGLSRNTSNTTVFEQENVAFDPNVGGTRTWI